MMDRRFNNSSTHWTSASGRKYAIRNLSDGHLINILRYLHRNANDFQLNALSWYYSIMGNINGEMARDAVESEVRMIARMDDEEFLGFWFKAYCPMVKEADRRRIIYNQATDVRMAVKTTHPNQQSLSAPKLMISFQPKGS